MDSHDTEVTLCNFPSKVGLGEKSDMLTSSAFLLRLMPEVIYCRQGFLRLGNIFGHWEALPVRFLPGTSGNAPIIPTRTASKLFLERAFPQANLKGLDSRCPRI